MTRPFLLARAWPRAWCWRAAPRARAAAAKVLRYAFPIAETNFDPAQITDLYSRTVAGEHLRCAAGVRVPGPPGTACGPTPPPRCPRCRPTSRTFTFRIKPGIYFADDPAFKGQKRELIAADYVYSLKRHYDPRWKSGNLYMLRERQDARPVGAAQAA